MPVMIISAGCSDDGLCGDKEDCERWDDEGWCWDGRWLRTTPAAAIAFDLALVADEGAEEEPEADDEDEEPTPEEKEGGDEAAAIEPCCGCC